MIRTNLVKRYVIEYVNDRKKYYKNTTKHIYIAFCEYSTRVIKEVDLGHITNDEAIKMIAGIDTWELSHGEYMNRFLHW